MVKTSSDVMDTSPLGRMEQLNDITNEKKDTIAFKKKEFEDLKKKKKQEIEFLEQKKAQETAEIELKKQRNIVELDVKKKELEELEEKEIKETEELIEKSFQDLMRHKRKILSDEEELKKTKNVLLEDVANTAPKERNQNTEYGNILEQLGMPRNIYDVTNSGFYSNLTELRNRAAVGQITPEEERFIDSLKNQFERFDEQTAHDKEKDQNNYIRRSLNILEQIDNYQTKR
jgi:hypothetical protein